MRTLTTRRPLIASMLVIALCLDPRLAQAFAAPPLAPRSTAPAFSGQALATGLVNFTRPALTHATAFGLILLFISTPLAVVPAQQTGHVSSVKAPQDPEKFMRWFGK